MSNEVKRYYMPGVEFLYEQEPTEGEFVELRLASDYAALQAECERLRMQLVACGVVALANTPDSAAKARDMHPDYMSASCQDVMRAVDAEMGLRTQLAVSQEDVKKWMALAKGVELLERVSESAEARRAKLDEEIRAAGGEEVEVVAWRHFGDATRLLCDLGKQRSVPGDYAAEFNIPLMTVAQHSRIVAAMAAELEVARTDLAYFPPTVRALTDKIAELRAELDAARKQEPVCEVSEETFSSDGTSDIITCGLPIGTKLYALPPLAGKVAVSRELLERAAGCLMDTSHGETEAELRDLLAQQA